MRFSGWLFDLAEAWRTEAKSLRSRHGLEQSARSLESAATDLEQALDSFFGRTFSRHEKALIAEKIGYSERQVDRFLKGEDDDIAPNANGDLAILDLPVKAGHLAKLLDLRPARTLDDRRSIALDEERERRSRPWIKGPSLPPTGT